MPLCDLIGVANFCILVGMVDCCSMLKGSGVHRVKMYCRAFWSRSVGSNVRRVGSSAV